MMSVGRISKLDIGCIIPQEISIWIAVAVATQYSELESEFLLVVRLMTSIHKDLWFGKLFHSSHQRGKPKIIPIIY